LQRSTEDLLIFLGAAQQFGERMKTVLAREDHTQQEKDAEWAKAIKEAEEKLAERDARRLKGDEILMRMGLLRPDEMPSAERVEDAIGTKLRQDQHQRFSAILLAAYRQAELEVALGRNRQSRLNEAERTIGEMGGESQFGITQEQNAEGPAMSEREKRREEVRQRFAERRSDLGPERDDDGRQRIRSRGISRGR